MASDNVSSILSIFDKVADKGILFSYEIKNLRQYIKQGLIVFDCDDNHEWRAKIDYQIFPKLAKIDFIAESTLHDIIKELNKETDKQ